MSNDRLFLKAHDSQNCDIISALLQDSIFHISHLSFHNDKKCLKIMVNRFCWELLKEKNDNLKHLNHYYRVHSGLYIYNVNSITVNGNLTQLKKDKYINLLSMHHSEDEINILFSGHKHICITTDKICVYLKDLHDKYPTPSIPQHIFR